ncbi:hypothetical protein M3484_20815 [Pseudomonas sp. GX19020]|uniref:phage tail tube protein n=1 Tax=Pseudomonas sp. GX19020 TaxID=2942277 RepID=UPI0020188AD8|nr:phage tail tube protein [Pseudomonas sp. GX19020]MCL4069003.1 hypothetical protein [Pseudomonas sp. GX19020]
MAASSGVTLGYGTRVRIGRGTTPVEWTIIKGAEEVQFPDQTPTDVDVTWLESPGATEESIRGLKTVATFTLPMQYAPGGETDLLLSDLEQQGSDEDFLLEITPSGGATHTWVAYVNTYRMTSATAKDKKMAEAVFKVKAKVSVAPPAAPANETLPAISGTARVGQVLTAWPGIWNPTGNLAYQWQVNSGGWTNIAGATGQTYTPIVGQVGNPLRVIVTATNGTGSTSATSAPTANVVAA